MIAPDADLGLSNIKDTAFYKSTWCLSGSTLTKASSEMFNGDLMRLCDLRQSLERSKDTILE